ncbi:MAG: dipeptidase [Cyclobacteriaceae bacterium]
MTTNSLTLIIIGLLFIAACNEKPKEKEETMSEEELMEKANKLAQQFIITDGHVDLPYRLVGDGYLGADTLPDLTKRTPTGDFDFERSKAGGLDAPFMSIYIPASYQETGGAKVFADSLIDLVEKIETTYPDHFEIAKDPAKVEKAVSEGKIALPMGMENGAPIEDNLDNVAYFKERGISYITLTHSKDNQICDSSYDTLNTHSGLSEFGELVVKEMNRVGIMVDISHVSDSTFYDVMALSTAPAIASHSSCRSFTPGWQRNMNDDMIKLLAEKGGVIQINFGSSFLDSASQKKFREISDLVSQYAADNSLESDDPAVQEYNKKLKVEKGAYSTTEKVADHIDHVVKIAGIDHVGLGSDYDGVGDSLPEGLKDVAGYPNLIKELLKRGYSDEDMEKICYKNVWRVWSKVLEAAG